MCDPGPSGIPIASKAASMRALFEAASLMQLVVDLYFITLVCVKSKAPEFPLLPRNLDAKRFDFGLGLFQCC